jgi:biotin-dependent carboxylase-like uncharacterized protein
MTRIVVVSAGPLTTIQDLGRPGWAHIGVPRSGAADRDSLTRANMLVGNVPGAPALETTLVGPKLRSDTDVVFALTGARVAAREGAVEVPMETPVTLPAGELLNVGTASSGLRTYIALRGGIAAGMTLGSAATDLLTGLGPAPLARGDVLELREDTGPLAAPLDAIDPEPETEPDSPLQVILGPRQDWFTEGALTLLTSESFTVTPASNRVGLRLDGPRLERSVDGELRSEGLVPGAIQVPPNGLPILLLADHPTTGGYPVIGVVSSADLPRAAQLRPGQRLRFTAA